mmetsp:Transcript_24426/g.44899  ORF Transcript_24426/g.44899 Transcript_24426/m.44899 type:complete len:244 (+) Transcript_24426:68-799(+)|eukprot:CAMPEP_0202019988 /NCGR_PEP_ID=MMETSP0905-20130828/43375_1 /ASSEMBLY_ACC=CAM_ASM_000554 /TAXON_ID=420261 /ORGANISM="Thalassiosira antarctica, Strain CCMP982" /LENGTH=243 /DNA_ID=CAMNT_0048581437 /DNA_START=15 /DNA_END=746 /DNA_ORIENTATION=-
MTRAIATVGEKKEGLLPSKRVSAVYDSHVQESTQGGTTVRILAFASGIGLAACSVVVWLHWIIDHRFSWLEMVVSITAFVVGICAFVLESNLSFVQESRGKITTKAPIFGQVRGRGSMYAAAGILQCTLFHPLDLLVGLFTAAVGIYMIKVGHKSSESLSTLKISITDEKALLEAFQTNDRNGDGVLEIFEFDGLVYTLGIELDSDELDAAFSSIDTNNDKKIVYDEFRTWWKACTAEAGSRV